MDPIILVMMFGTCVLFCFYVTFIRETKVTKFVKYFDGPPSQPVVGSILEFIGSEDAIMQKIYSDWPKQYGRRYRLKIFNMFYFTSMLPSDIEKILKSTTNLDKGDIYKIMDTFSNGLTHIKGDVWTKRRKLINPSFNWTILQNFQTVFDQQSKILLSILERDHSDEEPFDIVPYINRLALDIICETAMGVSINSQEDVSNPYFHAIERGGALFRYRATRPWLYPQFIWSLTSQGREWKGVNKIVDDLRQKVINERKAEMVTKLKSTKINGGSLESKKTPTIFIDLLLAIRDDDGMGLTDEILHGEVTTFIFVGNDTTSPAMSWACFFLANHLKVQEKVIEELDEIFGSDQTRSITTDDLGKMKYLECCIKETLRLRSPAASIIRKLVQDLVLDDETVVPAGINFYVPILQMHSDPMLFPEPDQFKPERFLPENSVGRHPFAFIPFSMGPRNCIGQKYAMMEMKTVMANILRNYRLETTKTIQDIRLNIYGVLRPADPLPITFKRRSVQCN